MDRYDLDRDWQTWLNARVVWAVLAGTGAKKTGGGKWSIKDFLFQRKKRQQMEEPKSPEQLLALAVVYNKQLGGKDLREKKADGDTR